MPRFRYKARDPQGQITAGIQDAANKEALLAGLKASGFTPLAIQAVDASKSSKPAKPARSHAPSKSTPKSKAAPAGILWDRVRDEDLLMFTRELESVIRSGVPILAGLGALANQTEKAALRRTIFAVTSDVEAGMKLSESLRKHPKIFSEVFVTSVIAGEASGQLPNVLNRLAALMEHDIETKASVAAATRYPLIVVIALALGAAIIVNFVLPKFADFYAQLNATLPLPSRILIGIATFVHKYWWFTLAVIGACIAAFRWYIRTPNGRVVWDTVKLKSPVFGPLFLKIALTRFAWTLETLYVSGVAIEKAFDITALVVENTVVAKSLRRVRAGITAGEQIAALMQKDPLFPPLVVQMIGTGEQTGNLDQHLRDVANHYNQQVKYTTKNLTTLIEPILTVILGVFVLGFALAVFLPMWNMMSVLGRH